MSADRLVMGGDDLFRLQATFGVPREVLEEWLADERMEGDWSRYEALMQQHREKSKATRREGDQGP